MKPRARISNEFRARASSSGSVETDLGETVGDESRAFTFQQPPPRILDHADSPLPLRERGRRGRGQPAAGFLRRSYVLEFAKKQAERLRAAERR